MRALMLLLLCLVAFSPVRENGFVNLDDREYIVDNPMVTRGISAPGAVWAFTTTRAGNWHPLTWLSHMLDARLFGLDAGRHHLASLAVHAGGALLLYAALGAMTGAAWPSFFAAALFAVHPLRVESVAWASERKDVLAMFFTLLAILSYVRALRRPGRGNRLRTAACFALALLAKPTPVTLPLLLLLLDWWPLGRWEPRAAAGSNARPAVFGLFPPAALWREKAPLLVLSAASAAATLYAQAAGGALVPRDSIPLAARAANAVATYTGYLATTLWPRGLSIFYPHATVVESVPRLVAGILLLAGVSALAWRVRARIPGLAVGWLWYLVALLPMIGLVQVGWQARADRYTYLPHVGLFALVVWGAAEAARSPRLRPAMAAAGAVAVVGCAAASASLVPHWRTSTALFTRAAAMAARRSADAPGSDSPTLSFIHNSLGLAYYDDGRLDDAIAEYRRALEINPSDALAMNNLGRALEDAGRAADANALYVRALADPYVPQARNNLGRLMLARGNLDDAIRLFREGVSIDPLNVGSRVDLGTALALAGKPAEAEEALRAAIALAPDHEPARFNLGKLLLDRHRDEEAIVQLRESIRLEPEQAAAHFMLGQASERAGRSAEAARAYRRALELDPRLAPSR